MLAKQGLVKRGKIWAARNPAMKGAAFGVGTFPVVHHGIGKT